MLQDNELASAETLNSNERFSAWALSEHKRASIRNWGMAAAVASSLGLALLYSWPVWDGQTSTDGRTARVPPMRGKRAGWGRAMAPPHQVPKIRAHFPVTRKLHPTRSADLSNFSARAMQETRKASANSPQGIRRMPNHRRMRRRRAQIPPRREHRQHRQKQLKRRPRHRRAARAPAIATAPPPARIAPAITGATAGAGSSTGLVRRPARWLGGGPSDADNWGGRYQGTVAVKVTVGPSGRVSNCVPVRRSGNAGLDAMTCRLVQERARFNPALNAQGQPVVSQAYTTFVWGRRRRY